jgi:hypothetical protein
MTIKNKLQKLSHTEISIASSTHFIQLYPCSCCGDPMLSFGIHGQDPTFHSDISHIDGIKGATIVWNNTSNMEKMTTTNFVDFLLNLKKKTLVEQN